MVSHVSLTRYCDTGPEREGGREGGRNNSCVFAAHGSAPHRCRLSLLWRKGKAVIIPSNNWQAGASSRTGGLRRISSIMLLGSFKSSRKSSHLTTDTSRPRIEGLHTSHGSMAAANCSYDHKIGGEWGEGMGIWSDPDTTFSDSGTYNDTTDMNTSIQRKTHKTSSFNKTWLNHSRWFPFTCWRPYSQKITNIQANSDSLINLSWCYISLTTKWIWSW